MVEKEEIWVAPKVPVEINEEIYYITKDLAVRMENGQTSCSDASSVCTDKNEEDTNLESDSSGSESSAPPVPKLRKLLAARSARDTVLECLKEHSARQIHEMRRHEQFLQEKQDQRLARFDRLLDILLNKVP